MNTQYHCENCGSEVPMELKHGIIDWYDPIVGTIHLGSAEFWQCPRCASRLLTLRVAKELNAAINKTLEVWLHSKPLREFVPSGQAATMLGITKEAFVRNSRIQRGFILSTSFCGRRIYLRESVERFREKGDGRFCITDQHDYVIVDSEGLPTKAPWPSEVYKMTEEDPLEWAVTRWRDEVAQRPLDNIHRRTLDDTWRQVIRYFGGNDVELIGPSHDDLIKANS